MSDVQTFIRETVTSNPVVLFMKGTAQFPQCGFSGRAIQILKNCGVTKLVTVTEFVGSDRFEVELSAAGISGGIVPVGGIGWFDSEADIQFVYEPLQIRVKAATPIAEALR